MGENVDLSRTKFKEKKFNLIISLYLEIKGYSAYISYKHTELFDHKNHFC